MMRDTHVLSILWYWLGDKAYTQSQARRSCWPGSLSQPRAKCSERLLHGGSSRVFRRIKFLWQHWEEHGTSQSSPEKQKQQDPDRDGRGISIWELFQTVAEAHSEALVQCLQARGSVKLMVRFNQNPVAWETRGAGWGGDSHTEA